MSGRRLTIVMLWACASAVCQSVSISDVNGLPQALAVRPPASPTIAPGRTAVIDTSGNISVAIGDPSDCVHVDGGTSPCGTFIDNEVPTGKLDGSNPAFVLSGTPLGTSLMVYRNGLLMKAGADYDLSANIVTFRPCCVPSLGDVVLASYRAGTPSSSRGFSVGAQALGRFIDPRSMRALVMQAAQHDSHTERNANQTQAVIGDAESGHNPRSDPRPAPLTIDDAVIRSMAEPSAATHAPERASASSTVHTPRSAAQDPVNNQLSRLEPSTENNVLPRSLKLIAKRQANGSDTKARVPEATPDDNPPQFGLERATDRSTSTNLPPSLRLIKRMLQHEEQ